MCRVCIELRLEWQRDARRREKGTVVDRPPPLHQLEPTVVAREVTERVLEHVSLLQMQMLDALHVPVLPQFEQTRVFRAVSLLARYARGDVALTSPVESHLKALELLLSTPLGKQVGFDGTNHEAEPSTALGVVVAASLARETVQRDGPLSTYAFAALAGLTLTDVHRIVRNGTLSAIHIDGRLRIPATAAKTWLAISRAGVVRFD